MRFFKPNSEAKVRATELAYKGGHAIGRPLYEPSASGDSVKNAEAVHDFFHVMLACLQLAQVAPV